ncbi:MAG: AAA family ATPase [Oscillospiraceae bacterium]|nr:AAA family ATPase [Oscillospiraceae bacterium]
MEKMLAIMIGIQGSGKSTFYHEFLAADFVHVNLDTLKTRNQEKILIEHCIKQEKSFAVDNTNPTKEERQRYIPFAKAAGYKIVGYFMESKLKECIERNDQRQGKEKVPSIAIASTSNKLQLPTYDEGFDELYFVKNDGKTITISEWRE